MFSLFDEINWRARGLLSPSIDTSDSLAWKTFPFNPVTSQKTYIKALMQKRKKTSQQQLLLRALMFYSCLALNLP